MQLRLSTFRFSTFSSSLSDKGSLAIDFILSDISFNDTVLDEGLNPGKKTLDCVFDIH